MGVRKKIAAENSRRDGRPEENGSGEFWTRWASGGKWQRRNSGRDGRPKENGGGEIPDTMGVRGKMAGSLRMMRINRSRNGMMGGDMDTGA